MNGEPGSGEGVTAIVRIGSSDHDVKKVDNSITAPDIVDSTVVPKPEPEVAKIPTFSVSEAQITRSALDAMRAELALDRNTQAALRRGGLDTPGQETGIRMLEILIKAEERAFGKVPAYRNPSPRRPGVFPTIHPTEESGWVLRGVHPRTYRLDVLRGEVRSDRPDNYGVFVARDSGWPSGYPITTRFREPLSLKTDPLGSETFTDPLPISDVEVWMEENGWQSVLEPAAETPAESAPTPPSQPAPVV